MIDRSVLIVDDNAEFRRLARQLLESGGYCVVGEAGNAGGALRAHAALRPNIVLLDIQLPDQDGFAVAESPRGRCKPTNCGVDLQPRPRRVPPQVGLNDRSGVPAQRGTHAYSVRSGDRHMIALDIAVGVAFLLAALTFRRTPAHAALLVATGLLWFAGDFVGVLVFAHRGPLTHFLLLYPDTRLRSWLKRSVVIGCVRGAVVYPIGQLTVVSVALFVAVLIAGVVGTSRVPSASLRSARLATAGAALLWGLLTAAAVARLAGARIDGIVLVTYQIALVAILIVIAIDNRYRLSRTAIVTSLAVDLGEGSVGSLRDVLAEVLGDPSVVVGLVSDDGFTDETGRPVVLNPTSSQVVTDLFEGNHRIAMLQHDAALLRDKRLLDSVTALAAVALANAQLQHEVRARIAVVEASRRRLLAVADDERDRLEAQLEDSVLDSTGACGSPARPVRFSGPLPAAGIDARHDPRVRARRLSPEVRGGGAGGIAGHDPPRRARQR